MFTTCKPIWREEDMKKLRRSNKGFSLVELIIVIAIMAILVGVMAPQLIKYIEKGKVSADTQRLDTIHSAIVYALMDPEVNSANDGSKFWIADFTSGDNGMGGPNVLELYPATYLPVRQYCKFTEVVEEVLGYNPFVEAPADQGFVSTPVAGHTLLPKAIVNPTGNGFAVYLDYSDRTGNKDGEYFTGGEYGDLEDSKVIFVK